MPKPASIACDFFWVAFSIRFFLAVVLSSCHPLTGHSKVWHGRLRFPEPVGPHRSPEIGPAPVYCSARHSRGGGNPRLFSLVPTSTPACAGVTRDSASVVEHKLFARHERPGEICQRGAMRVRLAGGEF